MSSGVAITPSLGGCAGAQWNWSACLGLALTGFVQKAAAIVASPVRSLLRLPSPAA